MNVKRINANIPIELFEKVESFANENMLNLTSAYITLLNKSLNYYDENKQLKEKIDIYQKFINFKCRSLKQDVIKLEQQVTDLKKNR